MKRSPVWWWESLIYWLCHEWLINCGTYGERLDVINGMQMWVKQWMVSIKFNRFPIEYRGAIRLGFSMDQIDDLIRNCLCNLFSLLRKRESENPLSQRELTEKISFFLLRCKKKCGQGPRAGANYYLVYSDVDFMCYTYRTQFWLPWMSPELLSVSVTPLNELTFYDQSGRDTQPSPWMSLIPYFLHQSD